ncbi:zinc ribbon domain-containing protein [Rossellomorea arthrocnemi]
MKFCTQCGSSIAAGKSFCENCGEPAPLSTHDPLENGKENRFCNECGAEIPPQEVECQRCASIPKNKSKTKRSSSIPTKRWPLLAAFLAILFLASGACLYYYVNNASSPSTTTEPFIQALKDGDAATLSDEIINLSTGKYVSESSMKKLITDLQASPGTLTKIIENMKNQEEDSNIEPFLFKLTKSPQKKWLFIDQYTISLIPVSFTIQTDKDAHIFLNEKKITDSGTDLLEIEDVTPGTYTVKAVKNSEFGKFETSETLTIWQTATSPIPILFKEDYVTVTSSFKGAEVFLNGKRYGKISDAPLKIGPIVSDEPVTISGKFTYPWGEVKSEEIEVNAPEEITLDFPLDTAAVMEDVRDDIITYNTSYIESITYLDSSVLRNVKGVLLQENIDTIKNLQKRNVTYGGRLENMIFDKKSFSLKDAQGLYKASINVEERYASRWNDPADPDAAIPTPKQYYYTYYCEYNTETEEWNVVDSTEHKSLTIQEPF